MTDHAPSPTKPAPSAERVEASPHASAQLLAVCVGQAQDFVYSLGGPPRRYRSAIGKRAVSTLDHPADVEIQAMGVVGDEQVARDLHGGLEQAVYVYSDRHRAFWQAARAQAGVEPADVAWGQFGENLRISAGVESDWYVNDQFWIGDVGLQITRLREPCFKFIQAMALPHAIELMRQHGCYGCYCSVIQPGTIHAGMSVTHVPGPRSVPLLRQARRRP